MGNDLISGRDIIVVGQQPWDVEIGSNNKNLAIEFSKNNRVLYVNSALDTITRLKHKDDPKVQMRLSVIDKKTDGLIAIQPNLWTYYPDITIRSINWIKSHSIFNYFNRINNKRFADSILKAAEKLGFKNYILFNDSDIFRSFYLKEFLKPDISIYYSRDYLLTVDYWKHHGSILEPLLIAKSDLCTANSTYLADYCAKYNKKSYYVVQGLLYQRNIVFFVFTEVGMFGKNFHSPCAGSHNRFAHSQVFINLTGVIADSDRVDQLRVYTNVKTVDILRQFSTVFRS